MKRAIFACLAGSLILPMLASAPALARKSGTTRDQCTNAVSREARDRFGGGNFDLLTNDIREVSRDENLMTGTARVNRRTLRYECTYNVRTERTYGVSLRAQGGGGGNNGGGWNGGGSGNNSGGWNGGGSGNNGGGWSGGGSGRLPGGSWARSCRGGDVRGTMLSAECKDLRGKWRDSQINVRSCPTGGVGNIDGRLVCQ